MPTNQRWTGALILPENESSSRAQRKLGNINFTCWSIFFYIDSLITNSVAIIAWACTTQSSSGGRWTGSVRNGCQEDFGKEGDALRRSGFIATSDTPTVLRLCTTAEKIGGTLPVMAIRIAVELSPMIAL